jgi:hypothetical protein
MCSLKELFLDSQFRTLNQWFFHLFFTILPLKFLVPVIYSNNIIIFFIQNTIRKYFGAFFSVLGREHRALTHARQALYN